jgi:hypothetical protein
MVAMITSNMVWAGDPGRPRNERITSPPFTGPGNLLDAGSNGCRNQVLLAGFD